MIIGEIIRNYRKAHSMSQLDLEFAIEAASGHISRIESGAINPTKETLLKIARALNLNQKDENILLGLDPYRLPTEQEIEIAIRDSHSYINNCQTPAYLSDVFWFLYDANKVILSLLGFEASADEMRKKFRGSHLLDWMFNPELPFRRFIPKDKFQEVTLNQLTYFMKQVDYKNQHDQFWLQELISRCSCYPNFKEEWERVINTSASVIQTEEKRIILATHYGEVTFYLSEIRLNTNPHFEIVEYIPL